MSCGAAKLIATNNSKTEQKKRPLGRGLIGVFMVDGPGTRQTGAIVRLSGWRRP